MAVHEEPAPELGDVVVPQADVVAGDGAAGEAGQDEGGGIAAEAVALIERDGAR